MVNRLGKELIFIRFLNDCVWQGPRGGEGEVGPMGDPVSCNTYVVTFGKKVVIRAVDNHCSLCIIPAWISAVGLKDYT